jgi:hypothetical protein
LVISGGYELRLKPPVDTLSKDKGTGDIADNQALTLIGHRLDLAVRSAIASARRTGAGANIYLPEPNLLIKWSPELIQVDALFGPGNKESIFLVRNYRKMLGTKSTSVQVSYDLRANAPTATPGRFKLENSSEPRTSIANFADTRITKKQLERICNQSQCYAKFDTWSIAVNDNLEVKASLIEPAFNACMITERYQYDPDLIYAALPRFKMPSHAELTKSLDAALSEISNPNVRGPRVKELVELLHRTGAATITFMSRLLMDRNIPDPVAEMAVFNGRVDELMTQYAAAPETLAPSGSPAIAKAPAAVKVADQEILQGLRDASGLALKEVNTRGKDLSTETIAEVLRILFFGKAFTGSKKAAENLCNRVRSDQAKRTEVVRLLGADANREVAGKTLVALLTPPAAKPPVVT